MIALTREQRQGIEQRVRQLANERAELTAYRSNMGGLRHHPVYQELLALGEPAVPLILGELERKPSASWFGLLGAIADESPIPTDVEAMASAWLEWGRRHGYLR
jgi:hypothetical protein